MCPSTTGAVVVLSVTLHTGRFHMKDLVVKGRTLKEGDIILESFKQSPPISSHIALGRKFVSFVAGDTDYRVPLDHELWVRRKNPGVCGVCGQTFEDRNQEDVCPKCWVELEDAPE